MKRAKIKQGSAIAKLKLQTTNGQSQVCNRKPVLKINNSAKTSKITLSFYRASQPSVNLLPSCEDYVKAEEDKTIAEELEKYIQNPDDENLQKLVVSLVWMF